MRLTKLDLLTIKRTTCKLTTTHMLVKEDYLAFRHTIELDRGLMMNMPRILYPGRRLEEMLIRRVKRLFKA